MKPLVVLLLVIGALGALFFALTTATGGRRHGGEPKGVAVAPSPERAPAVLVEPGAPTAGDKWELFTLGEGHYSEADIKAIHAHRRERAAGAEGSHFRKLFRKDLHGTLLANLQKVGLLTERIRPRLESVGIRVPAPAA